MRKRAEDEDISVPAFCPIINYDLLRDWLAKTPPPYVIKPRSQAGAIGIRKVHSAEAFWQMLDELGDRQSFYLVEQFIPGAIYHVDTIIEERKVLFSLVSKYERPPLEVSHEGRVFATRTVARNSDDDRVLKSMNKMVLKAFGMVRGVSHSEYIKGEDGTFYFLETSARVGGAHIAEMIEGATGLNLWAEWAKLETSPAPDAYTVSPQRSDSAALLVSLAKQEWPDLSGYADPEVYWRMKKRHHAGLVIASPDYERVGALLASYTERFYQDFFAALPAAQSPTH